MVPSSVRDWTYKTLAISILKNNLFKEIASN